MGLRAPAPFCIAFAAGLVVLIVFLSGIFHVGLPASMPGSKHDVAKALPIMEIMEFPVVGLEDVGQWRQHMQNGGSVRFEVEGKPGDPVMELSGLGRLDEEGRKVVRYLVVRAVEGVEHNMMSTLASLENVCDSEEEMALIEAEHSLVVLRHGAYLQGFDKGEYFLLEKGDGQPPISEGRSRYNVGAGHQGRRVMCVIDINDSDYALDHARKWVEERRQAWLVSVADRFNRRPDQERMEMIQRRNKFLDEDAKWREKNFPKGLRIDLSRAILLVE